MACILWLPLPWQIFYGIQDSPFPLPLGNNVHTNTGKHTHSLVSSDFLVSCSWILSNLRVCFDMLLTERSYFHSSCHRALITGRDVHTPCVYDQLGYTVKPFVLTLPDIHLLCFLSDTKVRPNCNNTHTNLVVSWAFILTLSCRPESQLTLRPSHFFLFAHFADTRSGLLRPPHYFFFLPIMIS